MEAVPPRLAVSSAEEPAIGRGIAPRATRIPSLRKRSSHFWTRGRLKARARRILTFRGRGRGHEVEDLGRLIDLYADWHSLLIPYYSFGQFVQKVEQVGASKRVRRCIEELRQRIANGGDPLKLHEPPTAQVAPDNDPENGDAEQVNLPSDPNPSKESDNIENEPEEMIEDVYYVAAEEKSQPTLPIDGGQRLQSPATGNDQITEAQKARMEANRLRALERAAERSVSLDIV
ncbi:zinc knuckle (CCHC-type) family protein isoform X2 [Wolffia australiana]